MAGGSRLLAAFGMLALLTAQAPFPPVPTSGDPVTDLGRLSRVTQRNALRALFDAVPSGPLAPYVRTRGEVEWQGARHPAAFIVFGDLALHVEQRTRDGTPNSVLIADPHDALELLADRRLAYLWPALTEWGGPGLVPLANRRLKLAREAYVQGKVLGLSPLVNMGRYAPLLEYTSALGSMGQADTALRLLQAAYDKEQGHAQKDWYALSVIGFARTAAMRAAAPLPPPGATATAVAGEDEPADGKVDTMLNVAVNRAHRLALRGRYDDAQAIFNSVRLAQARRVASVLQGVDQLLIGLQACIAKGEGRDAEAATLYARLPPDTYPASAGAFAAVPQGTDAQFATAVCMRDPVRVAPLLRARLANPDDHDTVLMLQPAAVSANPAWDALVPTLRADPAIAAAFAARARVLPQSYDAALNDWRSR